MKKNTHILPPAREHCKPYYYNLARVRVRAKKPSREDAKKARSRGKKRGNAETKSCARKNQVFAAR